MKRRLASLFLLLVLFGSAFAGVPMHFGETDCGMSSMMDMDCCKKARLKELSPEVADAKLCCALNCAQNGTTSPPGNTRVTPPPTHMPSLAAVAHTLPQYSRQIQTRDRSHDPPGSPPTYLRNLALLI